ncbi:MAG TPA: hypothetical protein VII47_00420 [Actinomycetota bacterium]
MLLALVAIVVVGGGITLTFSTVLALTSARSLQRALARTQAQLMPAMEEVRTTVEEVRTTVGEIAERAQRLRPQP